MSCAFRCLEMQSTDGGRNQGLERAIEFAIQNQAPFNSPDIQASAAAARALVRESGRDLGAGERPTISTHVRGFIVFEEGSQLQQRSKPGY